MKRLFIPLFLIVMIPGTFSCSVLKGYTLTEADAAAAIRQMLQIGTDGKFTGAFSKEAILTTLFPGPISKALNTLNTLGLTSEIDRFTTTLSTAAENTAQRSVPIFVGAITNLRFSDAMTLIKNGGTSATDYLRATTGSQLRESIKPVMQTALDEYKLNEQWKKIIAPVQGLVGNKINLDLSNLMAGMVADAMYRKIAEKETEIRNNAAARTTTLLQKVFSRNWN